MLNFIGVFNNLISVYVFILSRGLNRGMLRVKRMVHYLILVSCIMFESTEIRLRIDRNVRTN